MDVEIFEAETFTLEAINDNGRIEKFIEIEPIMAILEITTIPEVPLFTYYPNSNRWRSYFTVAITETNGIGGFVLHFKVHLITSGLENCDSTTQFDGPDFEPFGTAETPIKVSSSMSSTIQVCEPWTMYIVFVVYDENDYRREIRVDVPITKEEN